MLAFGGAAAGLGLLGARWALPRLTRPGPLVPLDAELERFVAGCFAGLERARVFDLHVHLVGLGSGGTGCAVDARMRSHLHPVLRLRYDMYLAASGVTDAATADADYLARLAALQRAANPAGAAVLLAFDRHVRPDGTEDPARTPFFTPDEYALRCAAAEPGFRAGVSIHPYRRDAVPRLHAAAEAGAVLVKWLPAAMGIDPASPLCDPFYAALATLGLPLLTHAGKELAVETTADERLGNPLRLRRALDAGVRVIVAHCAGLGRDVDLDATEGGPTRDGADGPERESFDLFLRMLADPGHEDRLFGDLSMTTAFNRCCDPLAELLRAEELHPRLLNASDYPVSAIYGLVSTRWLVHRELLTSEQRRLLNRLFEVNPLLFDLCVKRCLELREGGRAYRFAPEVFETARVLA